MRKISLVLIVLLLVVSSNLTAQDYSDADIYKLSTELLSPGTIVTHTAQGTVSSGNNSAEWVVFEKKATYEVVQILVNRNGEPAIIKKESISGVSSKTFYLANLSNKRAKYFLIVGIKI